MGISELARRVRTTTRAVRRYVALGLLPPPLGAESAAPTGTSTWSGSARSWRSRPSTGRWRRSGAWLAALSLEEVEASLIQAGRPGRGARRGRPPARGAERRGVNAAGGARPDRRRAARGPGAQRSPSATPPARPGRGRPGRPAVGAAPGRPGRAAARAYVAFNRRDFEAVLARLDRRVEWPNMIEGRRCAATTRCAPTGGASSRRSTRASSRSASPRAATRSSSRSTRSCARATAAS